VCVCVCEREREGERERERRERDWEGAEVIVSPADARTLAFDAVLADCFFPNFVKINNKRMISCLQNTT